MRAAMSAALLLFPLAGGCTAVFGRPSPEEHAVQKLASGMTIQELVVTRGRAARSGDLVEVHYHARLPDGTTIDSTRERGQPAAITLGGYETLRGLEEGIVGLCVAGSRRLVLTPELAYGPGGNPPLVPPETPITIDVELLRILSAPRD
jgi:FKBP-type peptidyl-prolyl cis-trans isomerase